MEKALTGFPELDAILDSGIPRPSCLSIQGDLNWDQIHFIYQLIDNFLENGLKGLYLCIDRPASDVRQNFQKFNLDITTYDQNYNIFFLDFFEESQKAFVETSTVNALEYEPNKFLETVSPFLEWIKNGFIIIDSVSTLALNMDTKEAYDLVRGVKMVGRLFNLISLGIIYTNTIDTKIVDTICTNADGVITVKDKTIHIKRTRGEDFQATLQFTKNADGKLAIINVQLQEEKQQTILNLLNKNIDLTVNPQLHLNPPPEVNMTPKEMLVELKALEQTGKLEAAPTFSSITCPYCNKSTLNMYLQCPTCQSQLLEKTEALEHFNCGHINARTNFEHNGKLMCPKCNKELKQIGVDYKRAGMINQSHIDTCSRPSHRVPLCELQNTF
jgi:KaiC/GvpD/RAD55 family RecA-like ATPase